MSEHPGTDRRRFTVLVNPKSGRNSGRKLPCGNLLRIVNGSTRRTGRIYRRTQTMNKGISKEMEIREVMKWQLLIAGAVDAAIKGTESYIRHMELTHQQGERRDCN